MEQFQKDIYPSLTELKITKFRVKCGNITEVSLVDKVNVFKQPFTTEDINLILDFLNYKYRAFVFLRFHHCNHCCREFTSSSYSRRLE